MDLSHYFQRYQRESIYEYYTPGESGHFIYDLTKDSYRKIRQKEKDYPYYIIEQVCMYDWRLLRVDKTLAVNYYVANSISCQHLNTLPLNKGDSRVFEGGSIRICDKKKLKSVASDEFFDEETI